MNVLKVDIKYTNTMFWQLKCLLIALHMYLPVTSFLSVALSTVDFSRRCSGPFVNFAHTHQINLCPKSTVKKTVEKGVKYG